MTRDIAIEDVLTLLRKATPQNGLGAWDHMIVAALSDAGAVVDIKRRLEEIEREYEKATVAARQQITAARDKREAAHKALVSSVRLTPHSDRKIIVGSQ